MPKVVVRLGEEGDDVLVIKRVINPSTVALCAN
jgi:hypothetical protein